MLPEPFEVASDARTSLFESSSFPLNGSAASPISSSGISKLLSGVEALTPVTSADDGEINVVDEDDEDADAGDPSVLRGVRFPIVFPLSTSKACKKRDTSHDRDRPSQM